MIPGFASAERAWENANPHDSDCTCEGEGFMCDECGTVSEAKVCPEGPEDCAAGVMRELEPDEIPAHFPSSDCPMHGWCTGCTSRNCEDCGGDPDDD